MSESNALAVCDSAADLPAVFASAKLGYQTVKDLFFKGLEDHHVAMGFAIVNQTGLSPVARHIYFLPNKRSKKVGDRWVDTIEMTTVVGIDGFRLISLRTKEYRGWDGPHWCDESGKWRDIWTSSKPPAAARFGVVRLGWNTPSYAIANYNDYCQRGKDGSPSGQWAKMPAVMLGKCAEALALRRAFPQELSGLYSQEEMSQAAAMLPPDPSDIIQGEIVDDAPSDAVEMPALQSAPEPVEHVATRKELNDAITSLCYQVWGKDAAPEELKASLAALVGPHLDEDQDFCVLDSRSHVDRPKCTDQQLANVANLLQAEVDRGK